MVSFRLSLPVLLALLPATFAQLPSSAPGCVARCFQAKINEAGQLAPNVQSGNLAGLCQTPAFVNAWDQCLADNCSDADRQTGQSLGQQVCNAAASSASVAQSASSSAASLESSAASVAASASSAASSALASASTQTSFGAAASAASSLSSSLASVTSSLNSDVSSRVSEISASASSKIASVTSLSASSGSSGTATASSSAPSSSQVGALYSSILRPQS
ncbi:hypothetical protein BJY59DRAFT_41445 [Rhodotorula toruloides]